MKCLEDLLGAAVLQRVGRKVVSTPAGGQLLAYAKCIVGINYQVFSQMTEQAFEGKITLGLPRDIVGPIIPTVLSRIHAVKIELISSIIKTLKE